MEMEKLIFVVRDRWGYAIASSEKEFSIEDLKSFSGLSEEAEERYITVSSAWETEDEMEFLDNEAIAKNSNI